MPATTLPLVVSIAAAAHETRSAGTFRLTVGWADEPAFAGMRNSVEVMVSGVDGTPVNDPRASLRATVAFGEERRVLALVPSGPSGTFTAPLLPTRPGVYSFQVTGTVGGEQVDLTSTCSEQTFDCVIDAGDLQFPGRDPSAGELARRLVSESRRADRLDDEVSSASRLAIGSGVLAALALVGSGLSLRRRSRRA